MYAVISHFPIKKSDELISSLESSVLQADTKNRTSTDSLNSLFIKLRFGLVKVDLAKNIVVPTNLNFML
ncbi:hypothetical protein GCM10008086_00670 [Salegentibacter mishustinae]|nr:hypothetical protein GCM10008086_00670 [Salegentibacter mishustinae]